MADSINSTVTHWTELSPEVYYFRYDLRLDHEEWFLLESILSSSFAKEKEKPTNFGLESYMWSKQLISLMANPRILDELSWKTFGKEVLKFNGWERGNICTSLTDMFLLYNTRFECEEMNAFKLV